MKKFRFTYLLVIFLMAFVVVLAVGMKVKSTAIDSSDRVYNSYTVKVGDTLWDIASELNEFSNLSTADYVSELRKLNSIYVDKLNVGQSIIYSKPVR